MNGEPLWTEKVKVRDPDDSDDGFDDGLDKDGPPRLSNDEKHKMTLFGENKYNILPSFFRTMIALKKQKRSFSVVFRTFGHDLENTIWEYNQFCNGLHPCFNGNNGCPHVMFNGQKGSVDMRIRDDAQKATFYRKGTELDETQLIQGTLDKPEVDYEELAEVMS